MKYCCKSVEKYNDCLAAGNAVPGGGSSSAVSAAMGTALLSMVLNFSAGRKAYAVHEQKLRTILVETEALRARFLELADLDSEAFSGKDMRKSLDVSFIICRLCYETMKFCPEVLKKGNPNLCTDVGTASALLDAAFCGAYLNARINLKIIGDAVLSRGMLKELTVKKRAMARIRTEIENGVCRIIEG
ncbi:MAG: cyclodeaminase/cyclohydrolase family protein [Candidatus Omnitrophota bacterium]|jgi:formiminotetrahydrofolate cyclodeaminase